MQLLIPAHVRLTMSILSYRLLYCPSAQTESCSVSSAKSRSRVSVSNAMKTDQSLSRLECIRVQSCYSALATCRCGCYTSRIGSYGRVSLGEYSERWGLDDCCTLLSGDCVWICIGDPDCIPFVILPSAKHGSLANVLGAIHTCIQKRGRSNVLYLR